MSIYPRIGKQEPSKGLHLLTLVARTRYQKLSKEELAERNRKRRERAKLRKSQPKAAAATAQPPVAQPLQMPVAAAVATSEVPALPETSLDDIAVAATVADQVIGNAMDDNHVQV